MAVISGTSFSKASAWEWFSKSVENKAVLTVVSGDTLFNDADDNIIRHKLAALDNILGLFSGFGAVFDGFRESWRRWKRRGCCIFR